MTQNRSYGIFSIPVVVGALGYFVDIYDLLLFGIVRKQSLMDLGMRGDQLVTEGERIISWQMAGLLIGGIIWGIMGDRRGRRSVLFGSILMYSLANIVNGMITTVDQYALIRFIAGIGLAGELGAGITLVAELLPKEKRGLGTSIVAGLGLTGAVVAFFVSQHFDWRLCYYIGGALGLLLLLLRVSVFESGMFEAAKEAEVEKGNLLMFFNKAERFKKYLVSILIGLPTWYVIGVLVTFSDQFAHAFGITENILPGKAIMFAYAGISIGDIAIGFVSQAMRSRKKALYLFYFLTAVGILIFFNQGARDADTMYWICGFLGFATGFWAIFVTMAAEQFGTNLRATAATTVPNVVRGSLPLILLLFKWLRDSMSYATAGLITGGVVMLIATLAAIAAKETFGKDLNFLER